MKSRHAFAIATALCLFLPALPVEAEIDRDRMRQDLDIMEGILQNLHAQSRPEFARINRKSPVGGQYIEDYGVLFLIEERGAVGIPDVVRILSSEKYGMKVEKLEKEDILNQVVSMGSETRFALQDRLADFLGTYADAIRQLQDEDRITILVRHKSISRFGFSGGQLDFFWKSHPFPKEELHRLQTKIEQLPPDSLNARKEKLEAIRLRRLDAELSQPLYSEVTAKKRDIVAYRREQIDEAEFRKRVVSRDHRPDASTTKRIGVMAAILDNMLKVIDQPVPDRNRTMGIYMEGLGVLFFVKERSGYLAGYRRAMYKELRSKSDLRKQGGGGNVDVQLRDRLKVDLVEVVGDYGHTVRTVKPDEYIVVEVRFLVGLRSSRLKQRGIVLKVKKRDVDAYSRRDLDLAAFRQKVDIQEY